MEIHHQHHHDHPQHKEKLWTHYMLEFFMLFLAVFCGFLAENFREKLTDREKEKQSIQSEVNCLASDTTMLKTIIQFNMILTSKLDSLIGLKNSDLTAEKNKKKFYEYGSIGILQEWYFHTNDAAFEQLKSSGTLRLIKKQNVIDSIFGYELKNRFTVEQEADCFIFYKETLTDFKRVADIAH